MSIISKEIRDKAREQSPDSDWVKVKDEKGKLLITKENPFIGRLSSHEYIKSDDPKYADEFGKKHILTWWTKDEKGKVIKKRQSTTSWAFMRRIADLDEKGVQDFKWWFEYAKSKQGKVITISKVVAFTKKDEAESEEEVEIEAEDIGLDQLSPEDLPEEASEEINPKNLPF